MAVRRHHLVPIPHPYAFPVCGSHRSVCLNPQSNHELTSLKRRNVTDSSARWYLSSINLVGRNVRRSRVLHRDVHDCHAHVRRAHACRREAPVRKANIASVCRFHLYVRSTFLAPVGIGLALFIAELYATPFTSGALNPARALGPDVIAAQFEG